MRIDPVPTAMQRRPAGIQGDGAAITIKSNGDTGLCRLSPLFGLVRTDVGPAVILRRGGILTLLEGSPDAASHTFLNGSGVIELGLASCDSEGSRNPRHQPFLPVKFDHPLFQFIEMPNRKLANTDQDSSRQAAPDKGVRQASLVAVERNPSRRVRWVVRGPANLDLRG